MSRTIRRKNIPCTRIWYNDKQFLFHTDSYPGDWHVPKEFRQRHNRKFRHRNKDLLAKGKRDNYEALVLVPHKRNVEWECY